MYSIPLPIVIVFIIREVLIKRHYKHSMLYTRGYTDAYNDIIKLYRISDDAPDFANSFRKIVIHRHKLPTLPIRKEK